MGQAEVKEQRRSVKNKITALKAQPQETALPLFPIRDHRSQRHKAGNPQTRVPIIAIHTKGAQVETDLSPENKLTEAQNILTLRLESSP